MPRVRDLLLNDKTKKRFEKSNYRPWNFMETLEKEAKLNKDFISTKEADGADKKDIVAESISYKEKDYPTKNLLNTDATTKNEKTDESTTLGILNESIVDKIFRLTGHQKKLFDFVVEKCFSRGMLSTGAINCNALVELLQTTSKMIKTTVSRLVGKGLIARNNGKKGRGGFYCLSITETVRMGFMEYKRLISVENYPTLDRESTGNQLVINKNTAEKQEENILLPTGWDTIDVDPLSSLGFTKYHLVQLVKDSKLTPTIVQDSINYFAFDLENNQKADQIKKSTPLGFFMGILRKGNPYAMPENYESAKDKALRVYNENKRKLEEKRITAEREALDHAFKEWFCKLEDGDVAKLMPKGIKYVKGSKITESAAREYFSREIWQGKLKTIA